MKRSNFVAVPIAVVMALAGCSGSGDREIKKALETTLGEKDICWKLNDMTGVSFPIRTPYNPNQPPNQSDALLGGLAAQEFIDVDMLEQQGLIFSQHVLNIELTEAGRAAGVWDPQHGFCIGRRAVADVVRWSEPAEQMGMQVTQVEYTWKITDIPRWLDKEAFAKVEGIAEPVPATAILRKMSDGWQVVQ